MKKLLITVCLMLSFQVQAETLENCQYLRNVVFSAAYLRDSGVPANRMKEALLDKYNKYGQYEGYLLQKGFIRSELVEKMVFHDAPEASPRQIAALVLEICLK